MRHRSKQPIMLFSSMMTARVLLKSSWNSCSLLPTNSFCFWQRVPFGPRSTSRRSSLCAVLPPINEYAAELVKAQTRILDLSPQRFSDWYSMVLIKRLLPVPASPLRSIRRGPGCTSSPITRCSIRSYTSRCFKFRSAGSKCSDHF